MQHPKRQSVCAAAPFMVSSLTSTVVPLAGTGIPKLAAPHTDYWMPEAVSVKGVVKQLGVWGQPPVTSIATCPATSDTIQPDG